MVERMVTASTLFLVLLCGCQSIQDYHRDDEEVARAEVKRYLKVLTGLSFDKVVEERELEPLFDEGASYNETALAARRAIRWRIEVAGGVVESGSINLSMVLASLLGKKAHATRD